jgi:membrane protein
LKWREFWFEFWKLIKKNELLALGGQVTYYLLLSFFPLMLFLFTLAGFADLSSEQIFNDLKYLFPPDIYQLVENIVYEIFATRKPSLLSIGMLGTLWASMNGIKALIRGMIKAYDLKEKRSFISLTLTSAAALVIVSFTLILSIIVQFFGEKHGFLRTGFRFPFLFVFLVFAFITLNQIATKAKYTPRTVLPGSVLSAGGWLFISFAFSIYFKHFNSFTLVYGSIGGIMILLLWLYWSCVTILLGCAFNAVLIKRRNYNLGKSKVAK